MGGERLRVVLIGKTGGGQTAYSYERSTCTQYLRAVHVGRERATRPSTRKKGLVVSAAAAAAHEWWAGVCGVLYQSYQHVLSCEWKYCAFLIPTACLGGPPRDGSCGAFRTQDEDAACPRFQSPAVQRSLAERQFAKAGSTARGRGLHALATRPACRSARSPPRSQESNVVAV